MKTAAPGSTGAAAQGQSRNSKRNYASTARTLQVAASGLREFGPSAQEIVRHFGGQWHGSYGMIRCPVHDDTTPSLSVTDSRDGRLLVHCHAGCEQDAVFRALKLDGTTRHCGPRPPRDCTSRAERRQAALELWRECRPTLRTDAEAYLRSRGITIPVPPSIRFHATAKHGPTGLHFGAMVGAVTDDRGAVHAVHRTFLLPGGRGKANVLTPKMALGPLAGHAVRLGPAGTVLGIAEGIETALSAMQIFELPVWASLSASRLARLELPETVKRVVVLADAGAEGLEAADKAAARYTRQGRHVTVKLPPAPHADWNDVLAGGGDER